MPSARQKDGCICFISGENGCYLPRLTALKLLKIQWRQNGLKQLALMMHRKQNHLHI